MHYELFLMPRALRELAALSPDVARRIMAKIEMLRDDLAGDLKRLSHHTPKYRLRVGDYGVLFEPEGQRVVVYSVVHRSRAY